MIPSEPRPTAMTSTPPPAAPFKLATLSKAQRLALERVAENDIFDRRETAPHGLIRKGLITRLTDASHVHPVDRATVAAAAATGACFYLFTDLEKRVFAQLQQHNAQRLDRALDRLTAAERVAS